MAQINKQDPPKETPAVQVGSMLVQPNEFVRYAEVQAHIEADETVNVSSEIGGRLTQVLVSEGQYLQKGQLVASTDLSTVEKQLDEINTQLSLASTIYDRQKRLWDQNIGSELQYLEAKTNKERLEKSLATLNSQLVKRNIYAPISGYVDMEFLKSGETAQPGMPIIQMLNTRKVKVTADVQENFLTSIKKGDKVSVYFPALDLSLNEKITQIGRTIDLNNRTFEIEIATDSKNGQLKPNLLGVVKFVDYSDPEALSIPLELVQEEVSGRKFVYLIIHQDGKDIARKSYIEIGESNVDEVIILSGIKAGDRLITLGSKSISDGEHVFSN